MAFLRTSSGLSNQYLFHKVDLIVFVEGGESYTKEEIDSGKYNDYSIDILFWTKILEKYKQDTKVKFKAVGSKTAVVKVAEDIVENNITTVYAAMDQEFDRVLGTAFKHKNVLYTFGYSWENDVWNEKVIIDIIKKTTAKSVDKSQIIKPFEKFLKEIRFSVYADGYLFKNNDSFFPRPNGHLKLVECDLRFCPKLKKREIESLLFNAGLKKSTVYSYGKRKKLNSKQNCYGHLINDFCRQLVKHTISRQKVSGLGDEIIRRMAIDCFTNFLEPNVAAHYQRIIK